MRWVWVTLLVALPFSANAADPVAGRDNFHKFRCDACHSLSGVKPQASIPLRDLTREKADGIAAAILVRSHAAARARFDEIAMAGTANNLTAGQLSDIVAYLRNPSAAAEKSQKKNR